MIGLLVANTVALVVAVGVIITLGVLVWKAEYKLAKYDESWMFKRNK